MAGAGETDFGENTPKKWYYTEHLVFALHTHAFMFVAFSIVVLLVGFAKGATWALWTSNALLLTVVVYFGVALRRVYEQGWLKTLVKFCILAWIYVLILLTVGFVVTLFLAALLG
jgi:hypothetical protein